MMCNKEKYNAAVEVCEIATQRLQCLNRRLSEEPVGASLTKQTRDKLRQYYEEHLAACEGITHPLN